MKIRQIMIGVGMVALFGAAVLSVSASSAQPLPAPEKPKNLKVLPKDMDPQQLRSLMGNYARSLGVRCTHCHRGQEGQQLTAEDFASDDNPKKDIARGMIRLVDSVNVQLKHLVPNAENPVSVRCVTCHHGVARPRTLAEELGLVYDKTGVDSTLVRYRALRTRYYGSAAYDFGEGALTEVARRALEKKDTAGALALLKTNVEQFPESGFVHGSYGEAYLAAGDTAKAIAEYERAVQLDPRNERAERTLARLRSK